MWQRGSDGGLKAISRVQAWIILKAASELADVRIPRCGPLTTEPSVSRRLLNTPLPQRSCAPDHPHDTQPSFSPRSTRLESVADAVCERRRQGGAPTHAGRSRVSQSEADHTCERFLAESPFDVGSPASSREHHARPSAGLD